jgi:hypothetical protein
MQPDSPSFTEYFITSASSALFYADDAAPCFMLMMMRHPVAPPQISDPNGTNITTVIVKVGCYSTGINVSHKNRETTMVKFALYRYIHKFKRIILVQTYLNCAIVFVYVYIDQGIQ